MTFRSSGFGYHKDQVYELKQKDVTMAPRQPVCTSVLYEKSADGHGTEGIYQVPTQYKLGKPASTYINSFQDPYNAHGKVVTYDGTEHVQRAGIQEVSKHAVLHVPGT